MLLWQAIYPPFGPNYGEGIGYGFAMMFWMFVVGIICGLLAASPWASALLAKFFKAEEPDQRLNLACFLLPIAGLLLPALLEGNEALLLLVFCFFSSLFALGALFFKPSRKIKQAIWSHVSGFVIATIFFAVSAYINLSGQQSPWFP